VATPDDVGRAKRALRRSVVATRDGLPAAERAVRDRDILARFAALPEARAASRILCFVSFGSEVATLPLIGWALRRGKLVAAPRVVGPRVMEARRVRDVDADLEPGAYGILEPRADLPLVAPEEFDLVVVPGSVFTPGCARLGYGGGFYDAYLRRAARASRIALAYEVQLVEELPLEEHDLPADAIVTELRVLRRPESRR
jgi:5-formyltetrahydrofolate cyclo-ligase